METRWKQLLFTVPAMVAISVGLSAFLSAGANSNRDVVAYQLTGSRQLGKAEEDVDPDDLYKAVWDLVKNDFYQENYNGQDWTIWKNRYTGKLKTTDDAHKAIETMLASLGDRYTRFLDRDAFEDEKSQISAKLCGIGIQIGTDKTNKIIVVAPLDGTPAQKAGIASSDEIESIDNKPTKGQSIEEAAKMIRGEINTRVLLTIVRHKHRMKFNVMRAEIPIRAVQTSKMLDGDIGYIRLSSFISQEANKEMREAITKLSSAKGLILDLRENPGGLLTNAIEIADMFLDHGNIVSTVDRDGYKTPSTADGKQLYSKPLCILINKGSASASEITSGALKDNGRAILVGQRTFGKGLVQGINRLKDHSGVNITIAKYLTPADVDINKKGISPDKAVDLSEDDLKQGKGPWWADPEGPEAKRQPEDLKDKQLKAAFDYLKTNPGKASFNGTTSGASTNVNSLANDSH